MIRKFAQRAIDSNGNPVILRKCTNCGKLAIELIRSVAYGPNIEVPIQSLSGEIIITTKIYRGQSWCRACRTSPEEREKFNQYFRDRYKNNPKFRDGVRQSDRNYQLRTKIKAMEKLGGVFCVGLDGVCPSNMRDIRCLQIDHIHGDGVDDRKKGLKGLKIHLHILKNFSEDEAKEKYQVLCANCNWVKRGIDMRARSRTYSP